MRHCGTEWLTRLLQKNLETVLLEREIAAEDKMPPEYLEPIRALWVDEGIKAAIAKGNEYALHDNLA